MPSVIRFPQAPQSNRTPINASHAIQKVPHHPRSAGVRIYGNSPLPIRSLSLITEPPDTADVRLTFELELESASTPTYGVRVCAKLFTLDEGLGVTAVRRLLGVVGAVRYVPAHVTGETLRAESIVGRRWICEALLLLLLLLAVLDIVAVLRCRWREGDCPRC